ncbi:hypothetical protein TREPR_0041 [Treponema primitia ZAS-2]|uniref:Uncharacterized protein n=1 Tax=Treponema primitia (strain ATCC BAA-887 / DSM 12427 / ZAS-2) TaxID=545694 RepID=F5YNE7_TREPZ|nr:hypothetical protein TREPR_0041 [Treponema primitia ZAS-2]
MAGFIAGCATPPEPEPAPAPAPRRDPPPVRIAQPAPPPPPEIPIRPITREILDLINKSTYEMGDLQYYISAPITLEHGKGLQYDIEIYPGGEGIIQETNAQEKIIIPKDTGGVLIPDWATRPMGAPRALKICFDDNDAHTLTFRENPADNRFYLAFREDRVYGEFTDYGEESYKLSLSSEIPYLYVRVDEISNTQPRTKELRGRYLGPREAPAESTELPSYLMEDAELPSYLQEPVSEPAPEMLPEQVPAAVQTPVVETAPVAEPVPAAQSARRTPENQNASNRPPRPPTAVSAPAPAPPRTPASVAPVPEPADEDEELDLEALLGM